MEKRKGEMVCEMNSHVAQNIDQCRVLVKAIMNIRLPYNKADLHITINY
jgi:hypothetical protein